MVRHVEEIVSGVGVLDKAVAILDALECRPLSLGELASSTGMPRATTHRLAVALERHRFTERDDAGRFRLGDRIESLGRAASRAGRSLVVAAAPALGALRDQTGESTQLYVADGDRRICVLSLQSPHGLRTMVAVGESLPMDRGSAGKVLRGTEQCQAQGWAESVEERERGVASVSAPVVVGDRVIAAVSVSGPLERTTRKPGAKYGPLVYEAARAVERALA